MLIDLRLIVPLLCLALPVAGQTVPAKPAPDPAALHLIQLHKRLVAKGHLSVAEMRLLADSGDSLAAYSYAKRLESFDDPEILPDALHYYSLAVYLGRDYGRSRLIALMTSPDMILTARQLKPPVDALARLAMAGDTQSALALAGMYEMGRPLARDAEAQKHWLDVAMKQGNGEAAQKLAMLAILPRDGSAPDKETARAALEILAKSGDPGKIAIAQNLLARLDATSEVTQ